MERQMAVVKEKKNKTRLKTEKYFDYSLLFIVIFLVCFGLVMIYSTSAYNSQISNNGDSFYYLKRQGMLASAGLVGMLIISRIPYHFWKRFTLPAYVVMNGMLLVVRQNYCDRIVLNETVQQFDFINAKILGVVFNCTGEHGGKYYGKGYYKRYYTRSYYKRSAQNSDKDLT